MDWILHLGLHTHQTLTLWTLFLWGYLKICVYQKPLIDLQNLKNRIRQAPGKVTNIMRDNTWQELASRLQMLQTNDGIHVEVYLFLKSIYTLMKKIDDI